MTSDADVLEADDQADDEDRFDPPPAWSGIALARRGGRFGVPAPPLDADVAAARATAVLDRYGQDLDELLQEGAGDADLAADARAMADGTKPTPSGAAALAGCVRALARPGEPGEPGEEVLVDDWAARHGIAFAAEAVVEVLDISAAPFARGVWTRWPSVYASHAFDAMIDRARTLLAGADDRTVAEARHRLEAHRHGRPAARVLTSFLLPSERDWVAADVAAVEASGAAGATSALFEAVDEVELLARLVTVCHQVKQPWGGRGGLRSRTTPITIVDGVGPAAGPVLARWLADPLRLEIETAKAVASVLAHLPTDEAFGVLLTGVGWQPMRLALLDAARRFPRRALRLLGAAAVAGQHVDLFRSHVLSRPDAAEAAVAAPTTLPAGVATLVESELAERDQAPPAPDELVPEILRDPPWLRQSKRPRPPIVEGLAAPPGAQCRWAPGEREGWQTDQPAWSLDQVRATLAERDTPHNSHSVLRALTFADPDDAAPVLQSWRPDRVWWVADLQVVAAAHGAAAHDLIIDTVRGAPRELAPVLAPYESPEVAGLIVGWLDRRTLRPLAVAWLRRHASYAAATLIPAAVGRPGKARQTAGAVLRLLVDMGQAHAVTEAAQGYGEAAAAAVAAVLATDPLDEAPRRAPATPDWVAVERLPSILVAGGAGALPSEAVGHLVTMLVMARPGSPYLGVERVKAACDPASLARAAWSLHEQWRTAGAPTKDGWVFEALGALGDDSTVEELLRVIHQDTSDPRAVPALDALVAIGSDAALLALKELSEKVKTKRVREGAAARMTDVAEQLGLTNDQLADRLVPELGLDADGSTILDFGPRRFVVTFDEQLRPTITDDGAPRKALPKPGVHDDPELAPAAEARFRKLKRDVKAVATDQIRRLERAMVGERRFTVDELRTLFVAHPLRWHVVRRLVWVTFAAEPEPGTGSDTDTDTDNAPGPAVVTGSFRVAEDRTLADATDREVVLDDDAVIGVAHPVHLAAAAAGTDELERWGDLFADYELLQPFPQLGRELFVASAAQSGQPHVVDVDIVGANVESVRFLGLERRGWRPPEVGDGGMTVTFTKPLPHGRSLVVEVEPGVYAGDPRQYPEQRVYEARLVEGHRRSDTGPAFADLGPVATSEVLRDLAWLRA